MQLEKRVDVILKRYDTQNSNFQKVWDFYIKFYTAWLTINLIGLGLVVEHVEPASRWPLVVAFVVQNFLTAGTSFLVKNYSVKCSNELEQVYSVAVKEVSKTNDDLSEIVKSPVPAQLAVWGGFANGVACFGLTTCWLAVLFLEI